MFLKNKNIIFKIRRSKVTDYAALKIVKIIFQILFVSFLHRYEGCPSKSWTVVIKRDCLSGIL